MKQLIDSFKNNSKNYFKTNILFVTFVVTSVINGILIRALTVGNFLQLKPMMADLAIVLIVGALGYFFKPKNQFKYFFTWSIIFTVLCIINSMYYTNYLSFASMSLLATSLQIVDVGDAVVENVMEIKDFCYIWQLLAMIFVNKFLKKKGYYEKVAKVEKGKIRAMYTLVAGLICLGFFISMLNSLDIGRLSKQWNREYIVMQFGLYAYQANDLVSSLKPQISPLFGYDEKAKEFREFYDNRDKTIKTNKYTNIFEGRNVIMIHAESIQTFAMNLKFNNKEVTPNLNKLSKEGIYFSNFYAQESVGTSSDSEFTLNTSLMPANSGTVAINYWDRDYVTIPKLLKEKGYYNFSMHGNNGSFWNRLNVHKSYGYDRMYHYSNDFELDEMIGLGLSDKSFFRQAVPKIKDISENHKNFYGTMIMLTNHTPFSDLVKQGKDELEVDYKYKTVNPKTGKKETVSAPFLEGTKLGNYLKSVNYADSAIGQFIDDLDKEGLLENTVVVIYGDHDAKLKKSEYEYYYNYDPYTDSMLDSDDPNYKEFNNYDYELNRKVPLIIWTKDKKFSTEVKEVMGMYDVMPTLGNMLGFHNDYALGSDIFSKKENVVVFPDGNWITDKVYYNSQKEESYQLSSEPISSDDIKKYSKYAEDAISISNSIIVYDMIKKNNETQSLIKENEVKNG